jgi:hypothetical protein
LTGPGLRSIQQEDVGVLEAGPERDNARVAGEVVHDRHLAVRLVTAILGQCLSCELLVAGPGTVGMHEPKLAKSNLLAELVLVLQPLHRPSCMAESMHPTFRLNPRRGTTDADVPLTTDAVITTVVGRHAVRVLGLRV